MMSPHDNSNCPLLHFASFDFPDFDCIGTRNSVAFYDTESFSVAAAA